MYKLAFFFLLLVCSCTSFEDDINYSEIISSKGEEIYILSVNWGVTGDYQLSAVTKNKHLFDYARDTMMSVNGINPFEFRFRNDTLTLFFRNSITYKVKEDFETIIVQYKIMNQDYYEMKDTSFHSVPDFKPKTVSDMPTPSVKNKKLK